MNPAHDVDVGERLFSRATSASMSKRSRQPYSAFSAATQSAHSLNLRDEEAGDIRGEVDRMYAKIMESLDDGGARWEPLEVSEATSSRIAATKALMRPLDLGALRRNTFGSGRRGMAEPVRKDQSAPGPGSYLNDSTNTARPASARGCSFGKSPRVSALAPQSSRPASAAKEPGPGDYYVPSTFDSRPVSRKGSFGRAPSPRMGGVVRSTTPGPGTYDVEVGRRGGSGPAAAAAFASTAPRLPSPKSATPGPGEYNTKDAPQRAPRGAIICGPPRPTKTTSLETPGPGTYNITAESTRDRKSRGVIPSAGRGSEWCGKNFTEVTPGPGEYNSEVRETGPSIGFHFHTSERKPSQTPGPGQYDPRGGASGPKWTMAPKLPQRQPEANEGPGPGEYVITMSGEFASAPSVVFPKAERNVAAARDNGVPGPGAYVLPSSTPSGGIIFGTAERATSPLPASDAPGPGAYNVPEDERGVGAFITVARRFDDGKAASASPGPGAYVVPASIGSGGAPVIGTAPRNTDLSLRAAVEVPGPGEYDVGVPLGVDAPAFTMGGPRRDVSPQSDGVGPGAYDTNAQSNRVGGVIGTAQRFREATADGGSPDAVGPGAYDVNYDAVLDRAPSVPIAQATRRDALCAGTGSAVGPGAYDLPSDLGSGSSPMTVIGTAPRFDEAAKRGGLSVPGPGAYDANFTATLDRAPAVVFPSGPGHAHDADGRDRVPGPGAYVTDAAAGDSGPSALFGTAPRVPRSNSAADVPGPGAYDATDAVNPRAPAAIMLFRHDEERLSADGNGVPGPGAYFPAAPAVGDAPRAIIGTAGRETGVSPQNIPGPGAYFVERSAVEEASPSVTIPKGARFGGGSTADETPGPGYYVLPEATREAQMRAPSFGTAPRPPLAVGSDFVPGPGAYSLDAPEVAAKITINAVPRSINTAVDNGVPGPGTYTVPDTMREASAPTIGAALRPPLVLHSDAPGPGAYTIIDGTTAPAVSIPKAPRGVPGTSGTDAPGPGAYLPLLPPSGPSVGFSVAPRPALLLPSDAPGPGAYNPEHAAVLERGPEWSIPRATPLPPANADVPGPGAYTVPTESKTSGITIGISSRAPPDPRTFVPGPGAYEVGTDSAAPAISFGKAARDPVPVDSETPGPGAYAVVDPRRAAPAVSFGTGAGHSSSLHAGTPTPGPGEYQLPTTGEGRAPSFPIGPRFPPTGKGDTVPGPGAYMPLASTLGGPAAPFGTSARLPAAIGDPTPGPGAYDPSRDAIDEGVKGFTFAPLPVNASLHWQSLTPGPGAYDIALADRAGPAATFTTSRRFGDEGGDGALLPGPGSYDPYDPTAAAPAFSFGTSRRPGPAGEAAADAPGPGTYDPNDYAPGPAYTIAGKPRDPAQNKDPLPGPGDYDTSVRDRGPSISFATAKHADAKVDERRAAEVPGPGAYALRGTLSNQGVTIPQAGRADDTKHAGDAPGPGQYHIEGAATAFDGPAYSIPKARPAASPAAAVPGPGAYVLDADGGGAGPAFSFGTSPREPRAASTNVVGPGDYDLGPAPYAGPAVGIARASPHGPADAGIDSKPGPGQYFHPRVWGDGGWSMQGKWPGADGASATPGPGQYHLSAYDPYARDLATVIDFGKGNPRLQHAYVQDVGPGPGQYNIRLSPTKGVPILERFPQRYVERTPGPPDYHPIKEQRPFREPLAK